MSFTRLRYHIVFATKNRAHLISPEVEAFLYPVLGKITQNLGGHAIRINGIEDHVHLICALRSSHRIDDFVRAIKSQSSTAIRKYFENLSGFQWQRGFGCFTLNPRDMAAILAYVENQKRHHHRNELQDLWERIASS